MKVLHVITGLDVGGAETMLARLMESAWRMPDIRSEIVTLMEPGPVGARIGRTGTPIHSLAIGNAVTLVPAFGRLLTCARRIRPDLIVGWMHHGQLAASLMALVAPGRVPVIWNVRHSLSGFDREKPMTRRLLRLGAAFSRFPAAIVYNSRAAARQYREFGYRPAVDLVIPNGFEPVPASRSEARQAIEARFGIGGDALLIGMVARHHPMKDLSNLLTAFALVREQRADAHLLIVGEGMDRPSPRETSLLASLPRNSWTLGGHRTDVSGWLGGLDMLALSSAWGEGFPNIVGEAMGAGVPCVATAVGDAEWVIGETGRVVPAGDPVALTHALLALGALGREGRAAMGQAARNRIEERFSLPSVVELYADMFRTHGRLPPRMAPVAKLAGTPS